MTPGLGGSPGEVKGYSLQYSYLENPVDRGAWQATVHGVTEWIRLNDSAHTHTQNTSNIVCLPSSPILQQEALICNWTFFCAYKEGEKKERKINFMVYKIYCAENLSQIVSLQNYNKVHNPIIILLLL